MPAGNLFANSLDPKPAKEKNANDRKIGKHQNLSQPVKASFSQSEEAFYMTPIKGLL